MQMFFLKSKRVKSDLPITRHLCHKRVDIYLSEAEAVACDCRRIRLSVRFPLDEIKCLIHISISLLWCRKARRRLLPLNKQWF